MSKKIEQINHWGFMLPNNISNLLTVLERTGDFFEFQNTYNELLEITKKNPKIIVSYFSYLVEDGYNKHNKNDHIHFSMLWLACILGEEKEKEAIDPILKLITTDGDYIKEAAELALVRIGQVYPNEVVKATTEANKEVIELLMSDECISDDFNHIEDERLGANRIHYYGIIAEFARDNKQAKDYLIEMFIEEFDIDDYGGYAHAIATSLATTEDKRILEIFKGRLNYLIASEEEPTSYYNEIKTAYYILDKGPKDCDLFYNPWEPSIEWEEPSFLRFLHVIKGTFNLSKKEEEELEVARTTWREKHPFKFPNLSKKELNKKIEKEKKIIEKYPIAPFDIEKYVQVEPFSKILQDCEKIIKKCGVERSVKKRITRKKCGLGI